MISHLLKLVLFVLSTACALHAQEDTTALFAPPRDYGHDWKLGSLFGITPEDGVLLGVGPVLYEYGFRTFPYVYRMELVGGLTLMTGHFKLVYTLFMPALSKQLSLDVTAQASELEVRNFFGYGNNSFRDEEKDEDLIYRVNSREYFASPILRCRFNSNYYFGAMATLKHFDIRRKSNRHIDSVSSQVLGERKTIAGAGLMFAVDFRDRVVATTRGFYFVVEGWIYPDPFKQRLPFNKWKGDARFFYSPIGNDLTLAVHVGGEKVAGVFPFYEAAFLGGAKNLRGYSLQRFGGEAAVFGSFEARFFVTRLKILVPSDFGLFGLADAGRVWFNKVSPGGWHADAGGGFWLAPLRRELTFSVAIAKSPDGWFVNGGLGFGF